MNAEEFFDDVYNSVASDWGDIEFIKKPEDIINQLEKTGVDDEIIQKIKGIKYAFNVNNRLFLLFDMDNFKVYIVMPEDILEKLSTQEKLSIATVINDAKNALLISDMEKFKNDIISVITIREFIE